MDFDDYKFEFFVLIKALSGFIKEMSVEADNETDAINVALEFFRDDYPQEAPTEIKITERRVNE